MSDESDDASAAAAAAASTPAEEDAATRRRRLLSSWRLVAAPMVGASDPSWRMLLRRHGAQLVYTQMLESERFVNDDNYRREMFVVCPEDRPLIVQFAANDAATFVHAAKLVEPFCDGIDLNLGCPQRAARTGLFGSYLLDDEHHARVFSMLRAAKQALRVPLLVKIRLLPTLERTLAFCAGLRACGIDGLAVHGRTRGFVEERRKGPADLVQLRAVVDAMHAPMHAAPGPAAPVAGGPSPPDSALVVWANGNVRCERDVRDNLATTGADGYMVGEALLNDPTLFARCSVGSIASASAQASPVVVGLTLQELRRKLAIVDEYVSELQRPTHSYYSPFASAATAEDESDRPGATATATATAAGAPLDASSSASFLSDSTVSDATFRTPLATFSVFLAHVHRVLNGDTRARFLAHAQLADELLDAGSIAEVKEVLRLVEERLAAGREFDHALQERIDAERAARQAARAARQRLREQQSSGVRVLNSKQRKRARWQQRKADAKRLKDQEGGAAPGPGGAENAVAPVPVPAAVPDPSDAEAKECKEQTAGS